MDYPYYQNNNYPIGSGVAEAACKVIVKEPYCQSGMKWKIPGAQETLTIKALHHTNGDGINSGIILIIIDFQKINYIRTRSHPPLSG